MERQYSRHLLQQQTNENKINPQNSDCQASRVGERRDLHCWQNRAENKEEQSFHPRKTKNRCLCKKAKSMLCGEFDLLKIKKYHFSKHRGVGNKKGIPTFLWPWPVGILPATWVVPKKTPPDSFLVTLSLGMTRSLSTNRSGLFQSKTLENQWGPVPPEQLQWHSHVSGQGTIQHSPGCPEGRQ